MRGTICRTQALWRKAPVWARRAAEERQPHGCRFRGASRLPNRLASILLETGPIKTERARDLRRALRMSDDRLARRASRRASLGMTYITRAVPGALSFVTVTVRRWRTYPEHGGHWTWPPERRRPRPPASGRSAGASFPAWLAGASFPDSLSVSRSC
jgi:hypothetical protein